MKMLKLDIPPTFEMLAGKKSPPRVGPGSFKTSPFAVIIAENLTDTFTVADFHPLGVSNAVQTGTDAWCTCVTARTVLTARKPRGSVGSGPRCPLSRVCTWGQPPLHGVSLFAVRKFVCVLTLLLARFVMCLSRNLAAFPLMPVVR